MAERAGLFEDEEIDLSVFTPKAPAKVAPAQAVREVAEKANFQSREPARPKLTRRRRTGRNIQINLKIDAATRESLYAITDRRGYSCLGETLEKALAALERELANERR